MTPTANCGCRVVTQETPAYGLVLQVVLAPGQSPDSWNHVRDVLEGEVERRRPQALLIDLQALDSLYGAPLIGALVAGAVAMRKLGPDRRARIVAPAHIAGPLAKAIRLAKIEKLFGGRIYADIESALRDQDGVRG